MSNDYIAHYGVKGMKWKNRKNNAIEVNTVYTAPGAKRRLNTSLAVASGVSAGARNTSKEYQEELEYNSRKNNKSSKFLYLTGKKIQAKKKYLDELKSKNQKGIISNIEYQSKKMKAAADIKRLKNRFKTAKNKKVPNKASKEYLEETSYNSRKNKY